MRLLLTLCRRLSSLKSLAALAALPGPRLGLRVHLPPDSPRSNPLFFLDRFSSKRSVSGHQLSVSAFDLGPPKPLFGQSGPPPLWRGAILSVVLPCGNFHFSILVCGRPGKNNNTRQESS